MLLLISFVISADGERLHGLFAARAARGAELVALKLVDFVLSLLVSPRCFSG
ncbi:MAG: hypothetical protein WKG07_21665 [Hymenobacter sp.]